MADEKALKPKSFRIDDTTAEKFKEISATIGGNQQETMAKLIEAYEFQSGKALLTEKKSEIEQFERYITSLTRMFMGSLEDNQNLTVTVRTEFEALLLSKDAVIQDLQEKLTEAKQLKEEASAKAKAHADENARLISTINSLNIEYKSKLDDMQSMLADKDSLNKALTDSCNDLKWKIETLKNEIEDIPVIQQKFEQLNSEHDRILKEKSDLENSLERQKEHAQIALDKAVLKVERTYQEQIEKLKADKQAEIDRYQEKYFNLLEQIKDNTISVE